MVRQTACRLIACAIAVSAVSVLSSGDAFAGWSGYGSGGYGSWGSSGGSYGSCGSSGGYVNYGSSGRVGPIRRLFQRIHAHHACSGGYASSGGSRGYYSSGGYASSGSSGGYRSYASSGSSGGYASSGSSGTYRSYASSGSSGGHAYGSSGNYYPGQGVPYYSPTPAQPGVNPGPGPGPGETTTSLMYKSNNVELAKLDTKDATLNVELPEDATVYVNGRLTKTPGSNRRYVSRNLPTGQVFTYEVKAIVERDGKEIVQTKVIDLVAGLDKHIEFDFDTRNLITSLTLEVPENAKVSMSGHHTDLNGPIRYFSTSELKEGQKWEDYEIEVTIEQDGKPVTQRRKIDLTAGESKLVSFNFDQDVKVASR